MKRRNVWMKVMALLLPALLLTACSSKAAEKPLQVMFSAPYVNGEEAAAYGEKLSEGKEKPTAYEAHAVGTLEENVMAYNANIMKIAALVATKDLDVMVCDVENAARNARGEMYYDLTEIFTEEELAPYADRLLSFRLADSEGNLTEERTAVCGIDVSDNENLKNMMGENSYGVFIISNTEDLEFSKEIFWEIVNS